MIFLLFCLFDEVWLVWCECCGVNLVFVNGEIFFCKEILDVLCGEFGLLCCRFKRGILIGVFIFGIRVGDLGLFERWWGIGGVEMGEFMWGVFVGVVVNDFWRGVGG